jgi:hypothetical protein
MWSRLTVVVRQFPHWQVRFRLLVLLRPTWRSQTWSCGVVSRWSVTCNQHVWVNGKSAQRVNTMLLESQIDLCAVESNLASWLSCTCGCVDAKRDRLRAQKNTRRVREKDGFARKAPRRLRIHTSFSKMKQYSHKAVRPSGSARRSSATHTRACRWTRQQMQASAHSPASVYLEAAAAATSQ